VLADHARIVAHTIQHTETEEVKRFVRDEHMLEIAAGIVQATKFHGLAHFDMRVDAQTGSLYVLECNPRVWGSLMYSVWAGVNFIALGCELARGEHVAARVAPSERVWHQGVAPRRMLKALLQGRRAPEGMSGGTLSSWQQAHRDPWIQLVGKFTERSEEYMREKLTRTRPGAKLRSASL
jgi:predicted ATP-grasp superfamily ATP-dependent carboligase